MIINIIFTIRYTHYIKDRFTDKADLNIYFNISDV